MADELNVFYGSMTGLYLHIQACIGYNRRLNVPGVDKALRKISLDLRRCIPAEHFEHIAKGTVYMHPEDPHGSSVLPASARDLCHPRELAYLEWLQECVEKIAARMDPPVKLDERPDEVDAWIRRVKAIMGETRVKW